MIFIKEGGGEYGGYVFKFYIGVYWGNRNHRAKDEQYCGDITRYCALESLSIERSKKE